MLVLSRKKGEEIVIADNIRIRVLEIRSNKVRFGILAPKEVPITRSDATVNNRTLDFIRTPKIGTKK